MKYKVLISAPYFINDIKEFEQELKDNHIEIKVVLPKERLEEAELLEIIDEFDGVICGDDRFTKNVYDKAKNLKVVVKWGTGIDSLNKEYAASVGIPVYNTLGAFTEPVSDSVMALMLAYSRQIISSDRIMKSGRWEKFQGFCLEEASLGIIGVGRIGTAVARKALPFGIKIYGNDIKEIDKDILNKYNISMVSKEELLKKCDFVSLNCDLNDTSYHIIDKDDLNIMKSNAILINTARGPLVNEPELVKALQENKIAGAGLDVFEDEPLPVDSPLRKMDNCILSSHNVNTSPRYWKKVHRNSIDMLYKGLGIK